MENQQNAINKILDPENTENIVLYNSNDEAVEFEQIFIMPFEGRDFAILKPVQPLEYCAEDEALVFEIYEEDGEDKIKIIWDNRIIDAVFNVYEKMLNERK